MLQKVVDADDNTSDQEAFRLFADHFESDGRVASELNKKYGLSEFATSFADEKMNHLELPKRILEIDRALDRLESALDNREISRSISGETKRL